MQKWQYTVMLNYCCVLLKGNSGAGSRSRHCLKSLGREEPPNTSLICWSRLGAPRSTAALTDFRWSSRLRTIVAIFMLSVRLPPGQSGCEVEPAVLNCSDTCVGRAASPNDSRLRVLRNFLHLITFCSPFLRVGVINRESTTGFKSSVSWTLAHEHTEILLLFKFCFTQISYSWGEPNSLPLPSLRSNSLCVRLVNSRTIWII